MYEEAGETQIESAREVLLSDHRKREPKECVVK